MSKKIDLNRKSQLKLVKLESDLRKYMNRQKSDLHDIDFVNLASVTEVESGKSLSSEEFKKAIIHRMNTFAIDFKLCPGHSIILLKNNSIEFFIDFLAGFFLGVTIIPLDSSMHLEEIERVIEFSKANLIIYSDQSIKQHDKLQIELFGIAIVLFTSGTTGSPKGVLISKEALALKLEILHKFIPSDEIKNTLCFLPTFFGHGLICNSLFPIFYGSHFYIAQKLTISLASELSNYLQRHQINFFSSVPSHWELIIGFCPINSSTDLKRIHCASAPLRAEKITRILTWVGSTSFYDVYGATEMLGWFASRRISDDKNESSFDDFWDVDYDISSQQELLIKSKYMFTGYWKQVKNKSDDFFNSGDLFIDNKICGRLKNTINKNGMKINTEELNSLYIKSNVLEDVASFPIDDDFKGEDICVFIVLKKNYKLDEFKKYCSEYISKNYYPQEIIIVSSIPINSRNKTSIELLRKTYRELNEKRQ